ncbi:MAG: hypothetical protein EPGJADBJ_05133 [Saprospiraceae bacterium]|nr:hypothetical protein [Saprospiraceae bacterium]
METIIFHCETVTPMFIAGADGVTPELRAPSIKGALRFWWRAMNGHLVSINATGKADYSKLQEEETKIFGGTKDGGYRSSFNIIVTKMPETSRYGQDLWDEIPFQTPSGKNYKVPQSGHQGKAYLLYSMFMMKDKIRPYVKSGTPFSFKIQIRRPGHEVALLNAMKGLVLLGNLGARSRRGAGSIRVLQVEGSDRNLQQKFTEALCPSNINSPEDLHSLYKTSFKLINHNVHTFSILNEAEIFVFEQKSDWKSALEMIGGPFQKFRKEEESAYKHTPNFGFPIVHRNMGTTFQGGFMRNGPLKDEDKLERRSSPLLFKVLKTNDSTYFPIVIWLNGDLIPDGYKIMDKNGNDATEPNTEIVEDFLKIIEPQATILKL